MSDRGKAKHVPTNNVGRASSIHTRIVQAVMLAWKPIPTETPVLDSNLETLSSVERVAEVLRFSVLSVESSISPNGGLRAWLKLNVLVALILAIPAIAVVPIITYLLSGFSTWSQFLAQIASHLLQATLSMVVAVLVVVIGGRIVMSLLTSQGKGHR